MKSSRSAPRQTPKRAQRQRPAGETSKRSPALSSSSSHHLPFLCFFFLHTVLAVVSVLSYRLKGVRIALSRRQRVEAYQQKRKARGEVRSGECGRGVRLPAVQQQGCPKKNAPRSRARRKRRAQPTHIATGEAALTKRSSKDEGDTERGQGEGERTRSRPRR